MAKMVNWRVVWPEVVDYARHLGLDPALIQETGFVVDAFPPTKTGRRKFRVTYRTAEDRVIELFTTICPPWLGAQDAV